MRNTPAQIAFVLSACLNVIGCSESPNAESLAVQKLRETSSDPDWETAKWGVEVGAELWIKTPDNKTAKIETNQDLVKFKKRPFQIVSFSGTSTGSEIDDDALEHLRGLRKLRGFFISGSKVTGRGLKKLKDSLLLEDVQLSNSPVKAEELVHLKLFPKLRTVIMWGSKSGDAAADTFASLENLKFLVLDGTDVSDVTLEKIRGLKNIESLSLGGTHISDAGTVHLTGFKKLKTLNLGSTDITDISLKRFREIPSLEYLDLAVTKITDSGVSKLAELPNLRGLSLDETACTGNAIKLLEKATNLKQLSLSQTQITDADMSTLAELKSLQAVFLERTRLTDEGIAKLASLPNLEEICVDGTMVTDKGKRVLKRASPKVKIIELD